MQDESMAAPEEFYFQAWLCDVTTKYKSLSDEKRNFLLKHLIANSEPHQLNFLSTHIPALSCRNFISHLPLELVTIILKYVSGKQIIKFRQVCKSWRDRIDSMTELWQAKAFGIGVNIQAISSNYPKHKPRMYKASYCLAEQFLSSLKGQKLHFHSVPNIDVPEHSEEGVDFWFNEDSITFGNCYSGDLQVYSFPGFAEKGHILGDKPFNAILQHKHSHVFIVKAGGNVVVSYNVDIDIELGSDGNSSVGNDDSGAGGIQRKHTFIGHTSFVSALDVVETQSGIYVITGSKDKTVKVWLMDSTKVSSTLFMTLSNAHMGNISEVHFLPCAENGEIIFISCDKQTLIMWSLNVETRHYQSCCASLPDYGNDDIVSFHFDMAKSEQVFLTQWNFSSRHSFLTSYRLSSENFTVDKARHWELLTYGFKAAILGAGSRFALLMCSISLLDFQLFDLEFECSVAAFTTGYRFERLPVKLYNTSWLNGFVFDKKNDRKPTIVGQTQFRTLGMLNFNIPAIDCEIDNLECEMEKYVM